MDVKSAVKLAITHIGELYEHEQLTNLGLEEVEYDQDMSEWIVTVGFSRPWDYPKATLANITGTGNPSRSFKIVKINDNNEEVIAIKNRSTSE